VSKLQLKANPTLGDIQRYVMEMEEERGFTHVTIVEQCLLMVEEVGELCRVIRKHHTSMGTDVNKEYDFDAAGEVADVLIMLTAVANRLDIDIEQALGDKEERNKKRTWK
jgi:NTP pyrophosphatase (non-canonical NTP hydrolase)